MFTEKYRESVRNEIINQVRTDPQIFSAASIGSYARNEVDQYSDIDLTFGMAESLEVNSKLNEYKGYIKKAFRGEFLFQLKQDFTLYGVFILPGCLQVDLSFTPQNEFGPKAYPFNIIFGTHTGEKSKSPHDPILEKFGLIVHHILRTKVCMERGQLEKSRHWLKEANKHMSSYEFASPDLICFETEDLQKELLQKDLNSLIASLSNIKHEDESVKIKILNFLKGLKL